MTTGPVAVPDCGTGPAPVPGRTDELAPTLHRLTAPNPGLMTGPGTNTYLVGRGELAVVDPGPDNPAHLDAIVAAAAGATITRVLVTHTHPDHAPGAAGLAERTGAEVIGFEARDGFVPDTTATDGTVVLGPSYSLRAVHTPGHAGDHLCWLLEGPAILLSGDHVMDGSTVVIRPPDGDMGQYLDSLDLLLTTDPPIAAIAPGHGRLIDDPARVIDGIVTHRLERERAVASALVRSGRATVDALVSSVYADVALPLVPVARFSLWAHLRKLVADGRAVRDPAGPDDLFAFFEPTSTTAP